MTSSTPRSGGSPRSLTERQLWKLLELRRLRAKKCDLDAEAARRIDVFGKLGYVPTERQALFHAAAEFDVLYGGSAGGGKTRALLYDDLRDAMRYPGIRIGAFRRTYGELKESLLAELAEASFAKDLGARWNG